MSVTRNEVYLDSVLREVWIDYGDGTGTVTYYDDHGVATLTQNLTDLVPHTYPSMDETGVLGALLVVQGVLPLEDTANAVAEGDVGWLVAEAQAWSLGGG